MVVQHNITAMNANRMLGVTTTGQSKSTEKYQVVTESTVPQMMLQVFQFLKR